MFTYCEEAGLSEPEYDFVTYFVCLTIRFKTPLTPHLTGDTINETLNTALLSTYELIKRTPGIQRKDLVAKSDYVASTISRHIAVLMEKGLVERRGSKKTGGYYVKK